jgi:uncharacterized protein
MISIFTDQQMNKTANKSEDRITEKKISQYFELTETALAMAKKSKNRTNLEKERIVILDTVERYVSDAKHFQKKNDLVNAFAALNYAHGWLDAGARIGIFDVHDSHYFAVD